MKKLNKWKIGILLLVEMAIYVLFMQVTDTFELSLVVIIIMMFTIHTNINLDNMSRTILCFVIACAIIQLLLMVKAYNLYFDGNMLRFYVDCVIIGINTFLFSITMSKKG